MIHVDREGYATSYTIDAIDAALEATYGKKVWDARRRSGFHRVLEIEKAGSVRFYERFAEDVHAAVLRSARRDLCTKGHFDPIGGWPDEKEGENE